MVGGGEFGLSQKFDSNVYVVDCGEELAMIDAGAGVDVALIEENIKKEGLSPDRITKILLTHSHSDHAGGADWFHKRFASAVYISKEEAIGVESGEEGELGLEIARRSGFYSQEYRFPSTEVAVKLKHEDEFMCGVYKFKAMLVPGHSQGSVCYHTDLPEGKVLFSGDTVFSGGKILLLNIEGSSLSDYRQNCGKLSDLGIDILLPGHGVVVLSEGQMHIDEALKKLKLLQPPPNLL